MSSLESSEHDLIDPIEKFEADVAHASLQRELRAGENPGHDFAAAIRSVVEQFVDGGIRADTAIAGLVRKISGRRKS
jgi:hypothetical protein